MTAETTPLPPVYFNHLYIVLDDKTYRAIQGSDYLHMAFPGMEQRATLTATGETWSGTYYYCQDNYLEFFGSGNNPVAGIASRGGHWQPGAQEGWAGLAFSADQPGGAAAIKQKLQDMFGFEPFHELRQIRVKDQLVNWFYSVKLAERLGMGSFDSWVMEYHADIFTHKGLAVPPSGELTRQAYLSSWNKPRGQAAPGENKDLSPVNAPVPKSPETGASVSAHASAMVPRGSSARGADAKPPRLQAAPVFSRVISATIHMDHKRSERYADILGLLGYARDRQGDALILSAHGFTLSIQPEDSAPEGYRLSSLRLAMSRPSVAPMTFVFAPRSKLVLNNDLTADWFFGE